MVAIKNSSICEQGDFIVANRSYGIITQQNYPSFVTNLNCARKLVAPLGKIIRVYITDINIEQPDPADGK